MANPIQDAVKELMAGNELPVLPVGKEVEPFNKIASGNDPLVQAFNSLETKIAAFAKSPLPTAAPSLTETPSLDNSSSSNAPSPFQALT